MIADSQNLLDRFLDTRKASEAICKPLQIEDYSVQAADFVSPAKWHLAHISWFWEEFILVKYLPKYNRYHEDFSYLFNSYYNNVGKRVHRPNRGVMTRPTVQEVYDYRRYIDEHMSLLLQEDLSTEIAYLIEVGINHEQQHQELLYYDIKYILGHQPGFPVYHKDHATLSLKNKDQAWLSISEGLYDIGHKGIGFHFDNELGQHKHYLHDASIATLPVSNREYLEFIKDGGYDNFNLWHDDGWQWIHKNQVKSPLYWHKIEGEWHEYDLSGMKTLVLDKAVRHLSYYEAFAFTEWSGHRLPTEQEYEIVAPKMNKGHNWEWTGSAYLPYPGFKKAPGALGEYNGKFMINLMVMRGHSEVTPDGHARDSYRNFFHPSMRWQYAGLRLAK